MEPLGEGSAPPLVTGPVARAYFLGFLKLMPKMERPFLPTRLRSASFLHKAPPSGRGGVQETPAILTLLSNGAPGTRKRVQNGECSHFMGPAANAFVLFEILLHDVTWLLPRISVKPARPRSAPTEIMNWLCSMSSSQSQVVHNSSFDD